MNHTLVLKHRWRSDMQLTLVTLNYDQTLVEYGKTKGRSWYHEDNKNSSSLVITVGDSWTWGDSLGNIDIDGGIIDDYSWRTNHIYGKYIADDLNSDWINIGFCGHSNSIIVDSLFLKILPNLTKQYNNITVIMTLTEICREIISDPIYVGDLPDAFDLKSFLKDYEKNTFLNINEKMKGYPTTKFWIGRNFTDTFDENKKIIPHIEKKWVDVIADVIHTPYPDNVVFLTNLVSTPLRDFLKSQRILSTKVKQDLSLMAVEQLDAIDWLEDSPLNVKKSFSKHPNEEAHKIWGEYLLSVIKYV